MKMIDGAAAFALANRSRTRDAPTPTIASMNSDAAIEKNAACASPATARASNVLPVPGGPYSKTPCGMRPPSLTYRSGVRRKSTISASSAFASSMPATSSKVTVIVVGSTRRACERPNVPRTPDPPGARSASREQNEHADEQQRRSEPEEERRRAMSSRSTRRVGIDLDAVGLGGGSSALVVPERRHFGGEPCRALSDSGSSGGTAARR